MALALQQKTKTLTGGAYRSIRPRAIQNVQVLTWHALAFDDGSPAITPPLTPDDITELDVLNVRVGGGLFRQWPEPNVDVFVQDSVNTPTTQLQVQPWLICQSIRAQRDQQKHDLWQVTAEYATPSMLQVTQDELELINLPASVATYPFLVETIWTGEDRLLYEENNVVPPGPAAPTKPLELANGLLYSEPFYGSYPKRTIKQSQYESFANEAAVNAAIEGRLFTVNGTSFQGDSGEEPRWKITEIDYQHVRLRIAPDTLADAWLMTYTIERSSLPGGWLERRAQLDKYYLDANGDLKPARDTDTGQFVITVKLALNGTLRNPQTGDPEYIDYIVQPAISWAFLK